MSTAIDVTDVIAWTREQITRREEAAREASPGPWSPNAEHDEIVAVDGITVADGFALSNRQLRATVDHIALNDPAAVLRRCKADRKILDGLLAQRHDVVDDCWYTCAAATEEHDGGETCDDSRRGGPCDCGRDARIERYARLIAEGYGWTDET